MEKLALGALGDRMGEIVLLGQAVWARQTEWTGNTRKGKGGIEITTLVGEELGAPSLTIGVWRVAGRDG